ncbi:MAG: leucine-rich repeat protein [Ruminococcus sp.]|nr:leucine-rich repeat protein [Ruminococcus sp.]
MNIRKIAAAAFSVLITGGLTAYIPDGRQMSYEVQAASEAQEYTLMGMKYNIYSDHAELIDGSEAVGDVTIPYSIGGSQVTVIGENAFRDSAVTSVSMSSVTKIESGAFKMCGFLENVKLSTRLTTIGSGAFADCPLITEIDLPESVTSVGETAFGNDKSLASVTFRNPLCEIFDKNTTVFNSTSNVTFSGNIVGYDNSTAQKYAEKYGYKFQSLGASELTAATTSTTKKTTASTTTTSKTTTTTTKTTASSTSATTTVTTTGPAVQGKPVFRLPEIQVYESDLLDTHTQRVTLSVEGADGLYCSSDIYLYFDSRLKLAGEAVPGLAVTDGLTTVQEAGETGDFLFLSTAGESDSGKDGEMWHIDFELPANAKKGDRYEIYVGGPKFEGRAQSLFTNFNDDSKGEAMTKHIFSVPAKGAIEVVADPAVFLGDVDGNGKIDGIDASVIITEYARLSVGDERRLSGRQFRAADVNCDGIISAVDASTVLSYYAYTSAGGDLTIEEYINTSR